MSKKHHRKHPKSTYEEMVYESARELAAMSGISYSEALGCILSVDEPYYGWENELTEEEWKELLEKSENTDYSTDLPL